MKRVIVDVDLKSSIVSIALYNGSRGLKLYDKWVESGRDEDFKEFADWISDDVASNLDFEIVDADVDVKDSR